MRTITMDPPIYAKSARIETTALVPVPVPLWVADDQSTPEAPDAEPGPSGVPQRPNLRQRLRLGSWIRRLLAAALVGIAIWWMVLPLFFPVTNQAVVNARLVQIRAPIDGTPVEFPHDLGDRIAAREMLARIVNPLADTTTLSHLKTREAELAARHNAVLLELDQVTKSEATCRETCQAYMKNRTAFLQSVVQQTEAALQIALVQQDNTNKEWARLDRVRNGSQSAVSVGEYDKATEMKAVSQRRIEAERAALDKSKVELKAAREGVYVSLETPSFLARAEELALKVKTLKNAQLETEQHLVVHKAEVEREQRRIEPCRAGSPPAR